MKLIDWSCYEREMPEELPLKVWVCDDDGKLFTATCWVHIEGLLTELEEFCRSGVKYETLDELEPASNDEARAYAGRIKEALGEGHALTTHEAQRNADAAKESREVQS